MSANAVMAAFDDAFRKLMATLKERGIDVGGLLDGTLVAVPAEPNWFQMGEGAGVLKVNDPHTTAASETARQVYRAMIAEHTRGRGNAP